MIKSEQLTKEDVISFNQQGQFKKKLMFERIMLRRPNMNVVMVARVNGEINEIQLQQALKVLERRHPSLRARIEIDEKQIGWLKNDNVPDVPIETREKRDDENLFRKIVEEQEYLFEFNKGPLIRFSLLQAQETSDIIINGHHTICDALGLSYLIRDILMVISNPEKEIEILPVLPTFGELIPKVIKNNYVFKKIMKIIKKKWDQKHVTFDDMDYAKLHHKYWNIKENKNSILMWHLSESKTSRIINRCHEEKISVYSALCTAFQAAQQEIQGNSKSYFNEIAAPVDLRNRLREPVGDCLGLYATSTFISFKYSRKKSFWDNARKFQNRLKKTLNDEQKLYKSFRKLDEMPPSLIDSFFFQKYELMNDKLASLVLKAAGLNKMIWGYIISNLGVLNIPNTYRNYKLAAIYGPFIYSDPAEKYLSIITFDKKMNFCFTYKESLTNKKVIERIRDQAMYYLLRGEI